MVCPALRHHLSVCAQNGFSCLSLFPTNVPSSHEKHNLCSEDPGPGDTVFLVGFAKTLNEAMMREMAGLHSLC